MFNGAEPVVEDPASSGAGLDNTSGTCTLMQVRRARGRRRALPSYGEIDLDISDVFNLTLVALPAGVPKDLDEDDGRDFPQCDAYGEDEEALGADFLEKAKRGDRRVGVIGARATPEGF